MFSLPQTNFSLGHLPNNFLYPIRVRLSYPHHLDLNFSYPIPRLFLTRHQISISHPQSGPIPSGDRGITGGHIWLKPPSLVRILRELNKEEGERESLQLSPGDRMEGPTWFYPSLPIRVLIPQEPRPVFFLYSDQRMGGHQGWPESKTGIAIPFCSHAHFALVQISPIIFKIFAQPNKEIESTDFDILQTYCL